MPSTSRAIPVILALAVAMLPAGGADARKRTDHDEVRRAVEQGEIKPLATILDIVRAKLPGEITSVEIENKKGQWLYEFRTIDAQGRLREVYVDARTAEIVAIKEK